MFMCRYSTGSRAPWNCSRSVSAPWWSPSAYRGQWDSRWGDTAATGEAGRERTPSPSPDSLLNWSSPSFFQKKLSSHLLSSTEVQCTATKVVPFLFQQSSNKWGHIISAPKSASSGLSSPQTTRVCYFPACISTAGSNAYCGWVWMGG